MANQFVMLFEGTGNSKEASKDSKVQAPTNVEIARKLLSAKLPGKENAAVDPVNGWDMDEWDVADGKRKVFYLRGLGAPQLNEKGEVVSWSWNPFAIFSNIRAVNSHFLDAKSQLVASGIMEKVAIAYKQFALNYQPDSEIYIMGFSRGSYTARLLITILRQVGLIDINKINARSTEELIKEAFPSYFMGKVISFAWRWGIVSDARIRDRALDSLIEKAFLSYCPNTHPDTPDCTAYKFREKYSLPETKHLVRFVGLWDCVPGPIKERVRDDGKLSHVPEFAFHALAADDRRSPYTPNLWHASEETTSEQRWFAGSHSDVGGGYEDDRSLANIPLQWILRKAMESGLDIDEDSLAAYKGNPLGIQHNSYVENIAPGNPLTYKTLFDETRRKILLTAEDEELSDELLERLYKDIKVRDNEETRTYNYGPSNVRRALMAVYNAIKFVSPAEPRKAPLLFNFADNEAKSDRAARPRGYSDVGQAPSLSKKWFDPADPSNNEVVNETFRYCGSLRYFFG